MSHFTKPPKTIPEQVQLLRSRQMDGDEARMERKLTMVNYYRLSGYWLPFKKSEGTFADKADFETIWRRYCFDRKLRLALLDAIERVEVAVRARVAYVHAHRYGTFAYLRDAENSLPSFSATERGEFRSAVHAQTEQSREQFVTHFRSQYPAENGELPVWMGAEVISFGVLCRFYSGMARHDRKAVSDAFGLNELTFGSWIKSLNATRNICAHHGRLFNRKLGMKPTFPANPRKHPQWQQVKPGKDRLFGTLTMLTYLLSQIAPNSEWRHRIVALLNEYPEISEQEMGFVTNWKTTTLWNLK